MNCLKPFAILSIVVVARATYADPAPAVSLPITRVTLYTSGVGYFERAGQVDGNATVPLNFEVGQINDVLKSLVLLDFGGGSIQPVTYAAKDPVSRQLQAFSVDLSDNPDRASLFNRLRGAKVTATLNDGTTLTGEILGVETQTQSIAGPPPATVSVSLLNILVLDGIHSIPFSEITSLKLDDPALEQEIREALMAVAQGRDADKRPVTLHFAGKSKRNVLVSYVTEAPVWQTSYRLLLGEKPRLQGWGLVQNTSQDDWSNVSLSLVSGRPISFVQDLYTPLYVTRPVIKSKLSEALNPVSYGGSLYADSPSPSNAPVAEAASGKFANVNSVNASIDYFNPSPLALKAARDVNGVTFAGDAAQRALNQSMGATGARLGEALFAYSIPVGVTIPRQQSAMIPFITSPIQSQKVGIYNADVNAAHPLTGARLKNTSGLHLLGGPISVYDASGDDTSYVGDALMDDTQPGQTRLISFALDIPIDANKVTEPDSGTYLRFQIVKGVITVVSRSVASTIYTFMNNGDTDQNIVVEHPNTGDEWTLIEPPKPTEKTADVYRFDVAVPAKKSTKLLVKLSTVNWLNLGIADTDSDTILIYMHDGAITPDVRAALQQVIALRQKVADANRIVNDLSAAIQRVTDGQSRIRENMRVLDRTSALYKRYAAELDDQETQLADLTSRHDARQIEATAAQNQLSNYLAGLTVGNIGTVGLSG